MASRIQMIRPQTREQIHIRIHAPLLLPSLSRITSHSCISPNCAKKERRPSSVLENDMRPTWSLFGWTLIAAGSSSSSEVGLGEGVRDSVSTKASSISVLRRHCALTCPPSSGAEPPPSGPTDLFTRSRDGGCVQPLRLWLKSLHCFVLGFARGVCLLPYCLLTNFCFAFLLLFCDSRFTLRPAFAFHGFTILLTYLHCGVAVHAQISNGKNP
jgi:hypothetical protein